MNLIMKYIVISFILCAFGETKDYTIKEIIDNLHHKYDLIQNAIVEFDKEVNLGFSGIKQSFKGKLFMKKPSYYRIEFEDQILVTDGVTVWAYSPINNQVIIDRYKESNNMISPVKFMIDLPKNYYISIIESDKKKESETVQLKLVPKDDRSFIKSVKLFVETNKWLIRKIDILDVNDTETIYTVKNLNTNTDISQDIFVFKIPEGTEVVDIRK